MSFGTNILEITKGEKYGRLTVVKEIEPMIKKSKKGNSARIRMVKCKCECGNLYDVRITSLRVGNTRSCGCLVRDNIAKIATTHGKSKTKLYSVWSSMRQRCQNSDDPAYFNYGGRGIRVYSDWNDFSVFRKWALDNGYKSGLSIDRINNDCSYSPHNCRWTTRKVQCNNTRSNVNILFNGKTMNLHQWAEKIGISQSALKRRLDKWPLEKALTTKSERNISKPITFNGKTQNILEWANQLGVKKHLLKTRLKRGWTIERTLTEPPN